MTKERFFYPSAGGAASIEAFCWLPKGEPCAVVQIVHGMVEHMERYEPFAAFLCEHGFAVCGNNHLGHGESLIDGQWGYFGEREPLAILLEDLRQMRAWASARLPGLPYLMMGHSMGSFLTRLYLTQDAAGLSGVILSGTGGPSPAAEWLGKPLAKALWMLRGGTDREQMLDQLLSGRFSKGFPDQDSPHNWVSSVPEEVARYDADPKTQFIFTVSAYHTLFTMLGCVSTREWAWKIPKTLPILLLSGDQDPVGDRGKGVRTVYTRLQAAGLTDLTLKLFVGGRHELLNERNRSEVFDYLLGWLTAHR